MTQLSSSWWWVSSAVLASGGVIILQVVLARSSSSSKEARRRWQHAIIGQAMVAVSYVLPIGVCIAALLLGTVAIYSAHKTEWYRETFGSILRHNELKQLPGAFFFLLGTTATAVAFELHQTQYAVLCLSFADPMAAWVGRQYPDSPRFLSHTSSLIGSGACFITAFLLGCFMFCNEECFVMKAIIGAMTCTLAEAMPNTDDNLMIPIATGFSVYLYDSSFS